MTADWVPSQISLDPQSGRILDTARGILIGLRRCRSQAAFQELLVATQRRWVPVFPTQCAVMAAPRTPPRRVDPGWRCRTRAESYADPLMTEVPRTGALGSRD